MFVVPLNCSYQIFIFLQIIIYIFTNNAGRIYDVRDRMIKIDILLNLIISSILYIVIDIIHTIIFIRILKIMKLRFMRYGN